MARIVADLGSANTLAFNKISFEESRQSSTSASFAGLPRDTHNDFSADLLSGSTIDILRLEYPYRVVDMPLDDVLRRVGGRAALQSFSDRVDFLERNWSRGNSRIMEASFKAWADVQRLSELSFLRCV